MNGQPSSEQYQLGQINAKLDSILDSNMKVILALIALVGATIGLKIVGTPPLTVILYYIKTFLFIFTVLTSFAARKRLRGWQFILGFGLFAGIAQITSILAHGETVYGTAFFLIANISLLPFIWGWTTPKRMVRRESPE